MKPMTDTTTYTHSPPTTSPAAHRAHAPQDDGSLISGIDAPSRAHDGVAGGTRE